MSPRLQHLLALAAFLVLALAHLHPGGALMLSGSHEYVLSDGTDPAGLPYHYGFLKQRFLEAPGELLFGAVHQPYLGAPEGMAQWLGGWERVQAVFLSAILPIEQISTGMALLGMLLDGLVMWWLARSLRIPSSVSWGMGAAWAVSAYTRARAKVHMGLVGIHHLPLVFLALLWLGGGRKRQVAMAAAGLLFVASMPHYYVILLVPLAPIICWFAWLQRSQSESTKAFFGKLLLAAAPAVLWMAFSVLYPLPPWVQMKGNPYPTTGQSAEQHHPFMDTFAARPMDYFTGDIGLGARDLLPPREMMNFYVAATRFDGSNPHERAQGIRWSLWLLAGAALLWLMPSQRSFWKGQDRRLVMLFAVFGLVSFWLSLPPAYGLSGWLHQAVSQFRVPNRAGIGVAFAVIMIAGLYLKTWFQHRPNWARWGGVGFVLLVLLELPPFLQPLPIAKISPALPDLTDGSDCGIGLRYPYVSGQHGLLDYYYFLQRMRGSRCGMLNTATSGEIDWRYQDAFSPSRVLPRLQKGSAHEVALLRSFADCVPLSWIVFGPPMDQAPAFELCQALGWQWKQGGVCHRGSWAPMPIKDPMTCLDETFKPR